MQIDNLSQVGASNHKTVEPIPGALHVNSMLLPVLLRDLSDLINWVEKHIPGTPSDPKKTSVIPTKTHLIPTQTHLIPTGGQLLPKLDRDLNALINWIEKHIPGTPSDPKKTTVIPTKTHLIPTSTQLLPKLDRALSALINWIEKHIPGTPSDPKKTTVIPTTVKPIPGSILDPVKTHVVPTSGQLLPKLDRDLNALINWLEKHIPGTPSDPKKTTVIPTTVKPIPGSILDPVKTHVVPSLGPDPIPSPAVRIFDAVTTALKNFLENHNFPALEKDLNKALEWFANHLDSENAQ